MKRVSPAALLSLLTALIIGGGVFWSLLSDQLASGMVVLGLDTARAALVAALILAALSALTGALIGRSRTWAVVGSALAFAWHYLLTFLQAELQPAFDPGGHLEALDWPALLYRMLTLLALALLCAFIGSAVGRLLAETLLDPLIALVRVVRRGSSQELVVPEVERSSGHRVAWQSLRALLFVVLLVIVATSSGDLFFFAPDIGLHLAPALSVHGGASLGTVVMDQVEGKAFMVYLPPSYNTAQARTRRYPVLYLLHGSPGGIRDWLTAGKADQSANTLIATGQASKLIMVMPDGNGRPGMTSEWGNSFDQRQLIEDYVSNELVNYVDQHYRTLADASHRAIGGLSMGGFGAMNLAIHHPTIFGSVIALGGYYLAEGTIWGNNARYEQANSPLLTIAQNEAAWKLRIYLGAATSDQPYYTDTLQFAGRLKSLGIPYVLDIQPGHHAWNVWQAQLYRALTWLVW